MFATTTSYLGSLGFARRSDEGGGSGRRGSFLGMNHLKLTDRGSIQLVDGVERFHSATSETFVSGRRVKITMRDEVFETFEETLMRFPDTLLGSRRKRRRHYVAAKDALVFDERDKFAFNAILFFYQSGGILSRPNDVPFNVFARELEFFELTDYFPDCWIMKTVHVEVPDASWYQTLWLLFEDPKSSPAAMIISWISFAFIVITTTLFCLETTEVGNLLVCETRNGTVPVDRAAYCDQKAVWFVLDSIITAWFFLEYFARLISAPRKLKFVFSFLGIIDFLSLVPYFGISLLAMLENGSWSTRRHHGVATFLRILRLIRVIRVLKLAHHIEALRLLGYTIHQCMYLLVGLMLLVSILTIALSSSIYLAERSSATTDIRGTPDAAWFVVITLTNVGYGDVVPETFLGKLLGAVAATLGVLIVFILPAPVLLNHFEEIYNLRKERTQRKTETGKLLSNFCKLMD